MKQKTLERVMGTALAVLGLYFISNFLIFLQSLSLRPIQIDLLYGINIVLSLISGLMLLAAGTALWIDSRHA